MIEGRHGPAIPGMAWALFLLPFTFALVLVVLAPGAWAQEASQPEAPLSDAQIVWCAGHEPEVAMAAASLLPGVRADDGKVILAGREIFLASNARKKEREEERNRLKRQRAEELSRQAIVLESRLDAFGRSGGADRETKIPGITETALTIDRLLWDTEEDHRSWTHRLSPVREQIRSEPIRRLGRWDPSADPTRDTLMSLSKELNALVPYIRRAEGGDRTSEKALSEQGPLSGESTSRKTVK